MLRVISGSLKGRKISGYDIEGTRPTMDRVKESLFASIQDYIEDSVVLDLFAGSGNLGIEAISNGCKSCFFVDCNSKCIKVIQENLKNFCVVDKSTVMECDYKKALNRFTEIGQVFDIIFVDPPYKDSVLIEIMDYVRKYRLLSSGGVIVLEYSVDILDVNIDSYKLLKKKKYGDKFISIYQFI